MSDIIKNNDNHPGYNLAIIGATGNVGRELLEILYERNFPVKSLSALASEKSVGIKLPYGESNEIEVKALSRFNFEGTDIVLSSPGSEVSKQFSPIAAKAGAVVIDNTSQFRMDPDIPLIVPEVNPGELSLYKKKGIVANPNCSTIQMVVALKPLHDTFKIKRVIVSTYQSTSGAGKDGMDELFNQTKGVYANDLLEKTKNNFTKQIAFNVIPHIDSFMDKGLTKEEWKMEMETKKILDSSIKVHANCVRVPTFIGHAEFINVETELPIDYESAKSVLSDAPGLIVVDHRTNEGYVTPSEAAGEDAVYISRIREDASALNGISFWCVADNLRKGAALNTVQIAEVLSEEYLRNKKSLR